MVNQTTLTGNGHANRTSESIRRGKEALAHLTELAELQVRLLEVDLQDCLQRMIRPTIAAVICAAFVLGCVPVVLLGVAELLVDLINISRAAALLTTATVAAISAAVVTFVAWRRFRASLSAFQRSREELARNVQWIRTVLKREHS